MPKPFIAQCTLVGLLSMGLGFAVLFSWRPLVSTTPGDFDQEGDASKTMPPAQSGGHGLPATAKSARSASGLSEAAPLEPYHPFDPTSNPFGPPPYPLESAHEVRERLNMYRPTTAEIQKAIAQQFRDAEEVAFHFAIGESAVADDRRFLDEAARVFRIEPTGKEDWWHPSHADLMLYNACSVSFGENAAYAISYTSDNTIYVWHKAEEGEFTYHMRSDGLFEVLVAYYFADVLQVLEQRFTQDQLRVNPTRILLLSTHEPHYHSYIETLKKTLPRHGDTVGKPEEDASIQATHEQNNE